MKTLLASAFVVSFLATAAVCATAGEQTVVPGVTPHAASASLPASASATADLKPSLAAEDPPVRRSVRVVLASPYVVR